MTPATESCRLLNALSSLSRAITSTVKTNTSATKLVSLIHCGTQTVQVTLLRRSLASSTTTMDSSDDSWGWGDIFFGKQEHGALCLLICSAIEKHLLTNLLTTVMCCEKMTMTGWRNVWSMKLRVQDQGEDQRRPGKRLYVRTVKHVSWIKRMPWTVANGERW